MRTNASFVSVVTGERQEAGECQVLRQVRARHLEGRSGDARPRHAGALPRLRRASGARRRRHPAQVRRQICCRSIFLCFLIDKFLCV